MRFWIVFSLCLVLAACQPDNTRTPLEIHTANNVQHFQIEIVRTPDQKERGLMFRESMPSDHGMLFLFPSPQTVQFWMENTLIPLDMLFIRKDGTIVQIHPMAKPHDETLISSGKPVSMVLEILGGEAEKQHIAVGDRVLFKEKP